MIKWNTPPPIGITRKYIAAFVKVFVLAAFLVAAVQPSAFAAGSLKIYNRSGERIEAIYCCEEKYPGWGDDKLGNGYLNNGSWQMITFSKARYAKVKVYFSGSRYVHWHNIDLNRQNTLVVRSYSSY